MIIEIKKTSELTKKEEDLMNKNKKKEWPKDYRIKSFKKEYPDSVFFFVKEGKEIVAFGTLRNLTLEYKKKKYYIFAICNIFTIKRGQGYGKVVISAIINYSMKHKKTAIGFCGRHNTKFYEKTGLNIEKNLLTKVVYKDPKTGKLKPERGDGLYYEGKDKLVSKLIKGKAPAYSDLYDW